MGVLLIASNLPALPAGKTYEMWVIPKGGMPRPAGLFQSGPQGTAMHILPGAVDPTVTLAVTVEPDSGSASPTSDILFTARLLNLRGHRTFPLDTASIPGNI